MNKLAKPLIILAILFAFGLLTTTQFTTPTALAQNNVINVCSHNATQNYNILGGNATTLRQKLDNPANFGPNGAYGEYDFEYINVGDNFTKQTLLDNACNIWFSGYEIDADYTATELSELQSWVQETNGQVMAGCDATTHDPVCALLDFSVTTDTDTHGFLTDTVAENPLNCNGALGPNSQLEMDGGVGGYFSGPGVTSQNTLAVHETGGVADSSKPIVIYTGKFFFTADINMIQAPTLSNGADVINNNDILVMNAFSALADASIGKEICTSVEPAPTPSPPPPTPTPIPDSPVSEPTCTCAPPTSTGASAPAQDALAGFPPISIYSLDNGSAEDSISDPALKTATGTIYGDPIPTEDRFGNANGALLFDGVNDYVETNEGSNFKPLTFSVWFRADDVSGEHSIVDSDVGGSYGHSLIIGYEGGANGTGGNDGTLDVQYHNGFWDTGIQIEQGKWYQAFVTYGDEMRLYLGAQGEPMKLVAQQEYTGTEFDGSNFRFGRHNANDPQWFKGAMDDIRFYDKELTQEEIKEVTECTCPPSEPPALPDKPIATCTWGDVHIRTPDGLVYDFQATGDFVLANASSGDVMLQARQEWYVSNPKVSINTAMALNVAGDKLEFYVKPERGFYLNGVPTDFPTSQLQLSRGGILNPTSANDFTIVWPDGDTGARVVLVRNNSHIDAGIARLKGSHAYEGICGNLDGNRQNDMQVRGGNLQSVPATHPQLMAFGDSWRVQANESLFTVATSQIDGWITKTGSDVQLVSYNPHAPNQTDGADTPLTLLDFDPAERAEAEQTCQNAGVSEPIALATCTYDVAATGDDAFVESAQILETAIAQLPPAERVSEPAVPSQGLPDTSTGVASEPACYWQQSSGEWVKTSEAGLGDLTFDQCYAQDSCAGGLGESGGGCYRWADSSGGEAYPWDGGGVAPEPEVTTETVTEAADDAAEAAGGFLSSCGLGLMPFFMLLGMVGMVYRRPRRLLP